MSQNRKSHLRFRFSLRTWFVILSLICVGVTLGNSARIKRWNLEKTIIADGTLIYQETKHYTNPVQPDSYKSKLPSPVVQIRDSYLSRLGKWSNGSPIFCCFDSIYYGSNGQMPLWVNDVLRSGELKRISLQVDRPEINLNLAMKNRDLVELDLMGTGFDPHAFQGIHKLSKLEWFKIYSDFDVSMERVLPDGLPANLKFLRIEHCRFESSDIEVLKKCRKLQELTLNHGYFNLQALAKTGLPDTLLKVKFYFCDIIKEDLKILARCSKLTDLDLRRNEIDLRDMDGFDLLKSVKVLKLSEAKLDASTFRWLSRLPSLKELDLHGCEYADKDEKEIVLSPTLVNNVNIVLDRSISQKLKKTTKYDIIRRDTWSYVIRIRPDELNVNSKY